MRYQLNIVGASLAGLALAGASAAAEPLSLNYDDLAFIEAPIAKEMHGFTVSAKQLYDAGFRRNTEKGTTEFVLRGTFETSVEKQLESAVTIGATLNINVDAESMALNRIKNRNRAAAYLRSVYGLVSAGSVGDMTKEATRRLRGTGNGMLYNDGHLGTPDELGLAYQARLSAYVGTIVADKDGRFDVGVSYERPAATIDRRLTLRGTRGSFQSADNSTTMDTLALSVVGEIIYGRLRIDGSLGAERLKGGRVEADRYFASAGVFYKKGKVTVSAEGLYGQTDGVTDTSLALGARYDIAKGISLNAGVNKLKSDGHVDGVRLFDHDKTEARVSARYEF
ncbi:MAG: hypothetical protein AAF468_03690 [Pseudomonadota bacterium]